VTSGSAIDPKAQHTVVLRPIGTPLPLGFIGLAVATTVVGAVQLGWLAPGQGTYAALSVLVLSVPLQAVASVFGFLCRDPAAGTGMALQSGGWAAIAVVTLTAPTGAHTPALGVALVAAALALTVPTVAAASKPLAAVVMGLTGLRFAVTAGAELTGAQPWQSLAGVLGLLLAAVALYAALAFELEGVRGNSVLPLWRTGGSADAMTDRLDEQVSGVAREAGVRRQL
jgi:uncharacterized protein